MNREERGPPRIGVVRLFSGLSPDGLAVLRRLSGISSDELVVFRRFPVISPDGLVVLRRFSGLSPDWVMWFVVEDENLLRPPHPLHNLNPPLAVLL